MGDLSRGNAYFGGITGGTEKVISAGACAADKSLNIVLYRLVFDNVVNYLGSYSDAEATTRSRFNEH